MSAGSKHETRCECISLVCVNWMKIGLKIRQFGKLDPILEIFLSKLFKKIRMSTRRSSTAHTTSSAVALLLEKKSVCNISLIERGEKEASLGLLLFTFVCVEKKKKNHNLPHLFDWLHFFPQHIFFQNGGRRRRHYDYYYHRRCSRRGSPDVFAVVTNSHSQ